MSELKAKELKSKIERKDRYILDMSDKLRKFGDELINSSDDIERIKMKMKRNKLEFSGDFHDMKTLCLQLIEAEKLNDILDAIANNIGYELTSQYVCGGANCSAENGLDHSPECVLEHELTVKGVSDES